MEGYNPMYLSTTIANVFIKVSEKDGGMVHHRLQKMMYLAHVENLRRFDQPLIKGYFQAFKLGPTNIRVYINHQGVTGPIRRIKIGNLPSDIDKRSHGLIIETYEKYKNLPSEKLVELTCSPKTPFGRPWSKAYVKGKYNIITNNNIRECLKEEVH